MKTIAIAEEAPDLSSRRLQVQLTHPIEPDASHAIVWWDQYESYTVFKPEHWEMQDGVMYWSSTLPSKWTQPLAIAVAYDGIWLGAWYSKDWSKILSAPGIEASIISALMRWFHLPLMNQEVSYKVEQFACTNAAETVSTWLDEHCLLPGLQFTRSDEGWLSVIRKIFFNWQPESTINDLVQGLSDPSSADNLLEMAKQVVWKLSRVSPILMTKVFQSWVANVCIPQGGKQQSMVLIQQLLYEIAEADDKTSLAKRQAHLLEIATTEMKVDANFIKKALLARAVSVIQGQPISSLERENIAVAMNI